MRFGNLTIASDCSPGRGDRKPGWKKARQNEMKCIIILFIFSFLKFYCSPRIVRFRFITTQPVTTNNVV